MNGMSIQRHRESRKSIPDWLLKDDGDMLREVIVRMVEGRAGFAKPQPGTQQERLLKAEKRCQESLATKVKVLDGLCERYVNLKCSGSLEEAKKLEPIIEGLDTTIVALSQPGAMIAGVLYFSWRCGYNSTTVSAIMRSVKPTSCRQLLHRARRVAEIIEGKRPARSPGSGMKKKAAQKQTDPVTIPVEPQPEIDRATRWSAENLAAFRARKAQ
jgi:hypothetical protein